MKADKVVRRSRNSEGEVVGTYNENLILNGHVREYSANIIAENMYAQMSLHLRGGSLMSCKSVIV